MEISGLLKLSMVGATRPKSHSKWSSCYYKSFLNRDKNRTVTNEKVSTVCTRMAYTHTAILRPFVRDYPGGPVPEETVTHSHLQGVVGVCCHSGFYEAWGHIWPIFTQIVWSSWRCMCHCDLGAVVTSRNAYSNKSLNRPTNRWKNFVTISKIPRNICLVIWLTLHIVFFAITCIWVINDWIWCKMLLPFCTELFGSFVPNPKLGSFSVTLEQVWPPTAPPPNEIFGKWDWVTGHLGWNFSDYISK